MIDVDIAIFGGGPAGCLAAIGAKKDNPDLNVCVFEKDMGMRHRVGEALLTGTIKTLQEAGIIDEIINAGFHKKIGAAYQWGEDKTPWYVNYPKDSEYESYPDALKHDEGRYAIHVPRDKFDALLREIAEKKFGITFIEDTVLSVSIAGRSVNKQVTHVESEKSGIIRAEYWIDASGQASILGNKITKREKVWLPRIAKYGYFKNINWKKASENGFDIHRTNIISTKLGWMWIIHLGEKGNNLTSIGFVGSPREIKSININNIKLMFPEICIFLNDSQEPNVRTYNDESSLHEFYLHPDYSYKCEELHGKNWALCGDSGLFLDPILSQGVTLACHYGYMRGIAASNHILGNESRQNDVTMHYLHEADVLCRVISQWYENNRSVHDWHLKLTNIANKEFGENKNTEEAFRWITNLENLKNDYKVYPDSEQKKINKALGIKK